MAAATSGLPINFRFFAVELDGEPLACPVGPAQSQGELPRGRQSEHQLRRLLFGESRLHDQPGSSPRPLRRRGRIEIHPQFGAVLVVDAVAVEGVALHARPYVAGEAVEHVLVLVLHAPADRDHVAHPAVLRVERRHDVIEERPLVEIGVVRVGLEREQQPSELQHVVDVARLAGAAIDHIAEFVGGAEVLVLAVTAGGEAMMLRHLIPEEARGQEVGRGAGVDEALCRSE